MGPQYLEELQDHGRDASKVARPISATQVFGEFLYFDEHPLGLRIHFLVGRGEDVIHPSCRAERDILLQHPRIEIVIAFLVKLNRIDKDASDYNGATPPGFV